MNESPVNLPGPVRDALNGYRARHKALRAGFGLLVMIACGLSLTLLAVALDRFMRLPPPARAALLVAIVATVVSCGIRCVAWPLIERIPDRRAAVRVGRRFPPIEEDLVSAVELSRASGAGTSSALTARALETIGRRIGRIDGAAAASFRPTLIAGAVCLAVLAAFGATLLARPKMLTNALHRLFRPDLDLPYYSSVALEVSPGDKVIAAGDPIHISARATGGRVAYFTLENRLRGTRRKLRLPCTGGTACWTSETIAETFRYRFAAGDALTPWYTIRVIPPPAIARLSARIRPPDYAAAPDRVVEDLDNSIEIVSGSALSIEAETVARGADRGFECAGDFRFDGKSVAAYPEGEGRLRSDYFQPGASGVLTIQLTDGFGLRSRPPKQVQVRVVPDAPPQVAIARPAGDLVLLPGDTTRVVAEARDEFGLRSLDIAMRTTGKHREADPQWVTMKMKDGDPNTPALVAEMDLAVDALGLVPGDTLEYKATASDYAADDASRRGESRAFRVLILDEHEHLERLLERLHDIETDLLRRAGTEREQSRTADGLASRSDESVRRECRAAEKTEREQARETAAVADNVESLLAELARNRKAPIELLSDLARLSRAIRDVASNPMRSAAEAFRSASESDSPRREDWLRQAGRSAENASKTLEDLARIADRMRRESLLAKLAEDAARIAARQRELRASTPSVAMTTAGRARDDLDALSRQALDRLAQAERGIRDSIGELRDRLGSAADSLAFASPSDARLARAAHQRTKDIGLAERAGRLADRIEQNILFADLDEQERVAESLDEIAAMLHRPDDLEALARTLDQFIIRQTDVNRRTQGEVDQPGGREDARQISATQASLERDVSEHSAALRWLAREMGTFDLATPRCLDAAAAEMRDGADDLAASRFSDALKHGQAALEHLVEARRALEPDMARLANASASPGATQLEALLLLQRTLMGQRMVNRGTAEADAIRAEYPERFSRTLITLTGTQSALRLDTLRLAHILTPFQEAAAVAASAAEKMLNSATLLGSGETGRVTRIVQEEAVALLEKLLESQQAAFRANGQADAMTLAVMRMFGAGGGFAGGTGAGTTAPRIERSDDAEWYRPRSAFEGRLSVSAEERIPAEYRALVDAYFESLRTALPGR